MSSTKGSKETPMTLHELIPRPAGAPEPRPYTAADVKEAHKDSDETRLVFLEEDTDRKDAEDLRSYARRCDSRVDRAMGAPTDALWKAAFPGEDDPQDEFDKDDLRTALEEHMAPRMPHFNEQELATVATFLRAVRIRSQWHEEMGCDADKDFKGCGVFRGLTLLAAATFGPAAKKRKAEEVKAALKAEVQEASHAAKRPKTEQPKEGASAPTADSSASASATAPTSASSASAMTDC